MHKVLSFAEYSSLDLTFKVELNQEVIMVENG